jgi:hypothetical protein
MLGGNLSVTHSFIFELLEILDNFAITSKTTVVSLQIIGNAGVFNPQHRVKGRFSSLAVEGFYEGSTKATRINEQQRGGLDANHNNNMRNGESDTQHGEQRRYEPIDIPPTKIS